MLPFIAVLWFFSLIILTGYYVAIFKWQSKESSADHQTSEPGVSVVIAVRNASDLVIRHLPFVLQQEYPLFEVIIMDDYSDQKEREKLEIACRPHANVRLLHNQAEQGKKGALTTGVRNAMFPLILCTDADCTPSSNQWIASMVTQQHENGMVLGYSPYRQQTGWLNLFVRFETVMTGIQYLSWALHDKPYMGVGRNLLYPRELFLALHPYAQHKHVPYGDDDLLVQYASKTAKVSVSMDSKSFVYTDAPGDFASWIKQKHRHVSAGHYYTDNSWWQPGLFGIAMIVHWLLLWPVITGPMWDWVVVLFMTGLVLRWIIYRRWARRLQDANTEKYYPQLEMGYAIYLAVMGTWTTFKRKKAWN